MRLPDNAPYRFLGNVDSSSLLEAVLSLPETAWAQGNGAPVVMKVFQECQSIVLRGLVRGSTSYIKTLGPIAKPIIEVIDSIDNAKVIRIARLPPGASIPLHSDFIEDFKYLHNVHFPLVTNEQVIFTLGDTKLHMPVGSIYEIDNIGLHSVRNDGPTDRIHLQVHWN